MNRDPVANFLTATGPEKPAPWQTPRGKDQFAIAGNARAVFAAAVFDDDFPQAAARFSFRGSWVKCQTFSSDQSSQWLLRMGGRFAIIQRYRAVCACKTHDNFPPGA
jgi:hypothetical protein